MVLPSVYHLNLIAVFADATMITRQTARSDLRQQFAYGVRIDLPGDVLSRISRMNMEYQHVHNLCCIRHWRIRCKARCRSNANQKRLSKQIQFVVSCRFLPFIVYQAVRGFPLGRLQRTFSCPTGNSPCAAHCVDFPICVAVRYPRTANILRNKR